MKGWFIKKIPINKFISDHAIRIYRKKTNDHCRKKKLDSIRMNLKNYQQKALGQFRLLA